jgi:hypothetical protein
MEQVSEAPLLLELPVEPLDAVVEGAAAAELDLAVAIALPEALAVPVVLVELLVLVVLAVLALEEVTAAAVTLEVLVEDSVVLVEEETALLVLWLRGSRGLAKATVARSSVVTAVNFMVIVKSRLALRLVGEKKECAGSWVLDWERRKKTNGQGQLVSWLESC